MTACQACDYILASGPHIQVCSQSVPLVNLVYNAEAMEYSILEYVCAGHISLKSYSICTKFFWRDWIHIRRQDILIPIFCLNLFVGRVKGL